MLTFPSVPPTPTNRCGARSAQIRLASPRSQTQLTFLISPKILRARFRCMTSFTSPGHTYYLEFLFWHLLTTHHPRDLPLPFIPTLIVRPQVVSGGRQRQILDTSSPRVRQPLHSRLLLTNPCAKRKVLSLTKPKGRIYKRNPSAIVLQVQSAHRMFFVLQFLTRSRKTFPQWKHDARLSNPYE